MTRRIAIPLLAPLLALGACEELDDGAGGSPECDGGPGERPPPTVALFDDSAPLTPLGAEAIAIAPAWLRHDLGLALRQQDAARADALAALLVDAEDPRTIDEIAFTIAHLAPETLADEGFYPELLALNAELVYARDGDLDYVALVETGEAGADDDFSTTATYAYGTDAGVEQVTVDREIYYWFVVHPKMEDESPWFIDAWEPCSAASLECAATPDGGWLWRDFLWEAANDSCAVAGACPTLDDWLPWVDVAWNRRAYGEAEGAIREIVDFMRSQPVAGESWLEFGAYGERSIQPNRIYGLGRGNCGEWADMTTAIARTALVPTANASPASWDHTWNSFFDGERWVEWEPVNDWVDHPYAAPFSNYIARGDGRVILQTPDYTDDVFTMEVAVRDAAGAPIPGASVSAWSPWVIDGTEYWSYAGEAPAGADGVAAFPLVAEQKYAIRIETPIGTWPEAENTIAYASENVAAGETDVREYALAATLPAPLPATEVAPDGPPEARVFLYSVGASGRLTTWSQRFGTTYTAEAPAPELQALLVDADNHALLEAGEPFDAAWAAFASGVLDAEIDVPLDRPWRVVLSNAGEVSRAALGSLLVEVIPLAPGALWADPVSLETSYELLPGGRLAVEITPR